VTFWPKINPISGAWRWSYVPNSACPTFNRFEFLSYRANDMQCVHREAYAKCFYNNLKFIVTNFRRIWHCSFISRCLSKWFKTNPIQLASESIMIKKLIHLMPLKHYKYEACRWAPRKQRSLTQNAVNLSQFRPVPVLNYVYNYQRCTKWVAAWVQRSALFVRLSVYSHDNSTSYPAMATVSFRQLELFSTLFTFMDLLSFLWFVAFVLV